jgi:hypothetical protein
MNPIFLPLTVIAPAILGFTDSSVWYVLAWFAVASAWFHFSMRRVSGALQPDAPAPVKGMPIGFYVGMAAAHFGVFYLVQWAAN